MLSCFTSRSEGRFVSIVPVYQDQFDSWLKDEKERVRNIIYNNKFLAKPGSFCLIVDKDGNLEQVLLGIKDNDDLFSFGALPKVLPEGVYVIYADDFSSKQLENAAIGWGLGSYQFTKYKDEKEFGGKLLCDDKFNLDRIDKIVSSIFLTRDLINMPPGDLYPEKLAEIAIDLAEEFNADFEIVKNDMLKNNFPAVYAVGKGSKNKPILIDMSYGNPDDPKIVLVGKGVCFDSGGLQLKSSSAILTMKKDMAGSAHVLGLARMIMGLKLPINLRVIIPMVENLISGDVLKPGDIIKTRKGLTVEIDNTDAEGRLILADALALASEYHPDLILDFATLTGAVHVALGSDIVALFSNDNQIADEVNLSMWQESEPIWRMPLHQKYLESLEGDIADLKNISSSKNFGGGSITAALFLEQFVSKDISWAHFDMYAYNDSTTPGKPKGGEAMCLRGVFNFLENKFLT